MPVRPALTIAFIVPLALFACRQQERPPDLRALIAQLKSPEPEKSGRARLELITQGEAAVPALVEMLRGGDPREQMLAATTLWGMGPRAATAVPDLAAVLALPDPELRLTAAMAFETIGPAASAAVPGLVKALSDRDRRVRQAAVKALGSIGPAARAALPALTARLKRGSWPEAEEAVLRIRGQEASPEPVGAPSEAR